MGEYSFIGIFFTEAENREALIEILNQVTILLEDLDACHIYLVHKDADDPGKIWVFERWESREAHDQSLAHPQFMDLIAQARPLLTARPEANHLIPVGEG